MSELRRIDFENGFMEIEPFEGKKNKFSLAKLNVGDLTFIRDGEGNHFNGDIIIKEMKWNEGKNALLLNSGEVISREGECSSDRSAGRLLEILMGSKKEAAKAWMERFEKELDLVVACCDMFSYKKAAHKLAEVKLQQGDGPADELMKGKYGCKLIFTGEDKGRLNRLGLIDANQFKSEDMERKEFKEW
jgi:hypothetical protein